jgi:hypothetical protein
MSCFFLFCLLSAEPVAEPDSAARQRPLELVKQLGDPSFKQREAASKQLIRLGSAARDALEQGTKHTDLEISTRCRHLLPLALDWDLQQQVDRFLAHPDRPPPENLPGLPRFVQLLGKGEETRTLYLAVRKAHGRLLADFERHPENKAKLFEAFCHEPMKNYDFKDLATVRAVTRSEVILFLVLASDAKCNPGWSTPWLRTWAFNAPQLHEALSGPHASPAIQKLFRVWLDRETLDVSLEWALGLVIRYQLKDCLPTIRKLLRKGPQSVLCTAMLALKTIGSKEDLKDLERHFQNSTLVLATVSHDSHPGKEFSVQLGDVALGVSVLLSGQRLQDYGFDYPNTILSQTAYQFAFSSDALRQAARKKWSAGNEPSK